MFVVIVFISFPLYYLHVHGVAIHTFSLILSSCFRRLCAMIERMSEWVREWADGYELKQDNQRGNNEWDVKNVSCWNVRILICLAGKCARWEIVPGSAECDDISYTLTWIRLIRIEHWTVLCAHIKIHVSAMFLSVAHIRRADLRSVHILIWPFVFVAVIVSCCDGANWQIYVCGFVVGFWFDCKYQPHVTWHVFTYAQHLYEQIPMGNGWHAFSLTSIYC